VLRIVASRSFSQLTKNVIRSSHGHSTPSSDWLTSRLKLTFLTTFCRFQVQLVGVAHGHSTPSSDWLTSRLKLTFLTTFCRFQVQLVGVAQQLQKNNNVYFL